MSDSHYNYFVAAAVIAAKLDKATKVAQQLSLTASNARAVALRAGEKAAGFRPLTDFIDRLANVTIKYSIQINALAAQLSKTAADKFRADAAIDKFNVVYQRAQGEINLSTLDKSFQRTQNHQNVLLRAFQRQIKQLSEQLDHINAELRTAVILATLSRVEASQAGSIYQTSLNNVADNVESAADIIKKHILSSQQLVASLT